MTNRFLAFSAKKGGGKDTSTNYLHGMEMVGLNLVDHFRVNEKGKLTVPGEFGKGDESEVTDGVFELSRTDPVFTDWMGEHIWPWIKKYSFAEILKRDVCMRILGLSESQCFGTDDEKNTPTSLLWENMPGVVTDKLDLDDEELTPLTGRLGLYYNTMEAGTVYHEPGPMTARQVMQYVGTEVFRKMYGDVWADATIRHIQSEGSAFAIICDCRFQNEVEAVQNAGGKVIRFTRFINDDEDVHESELALDGYEGFDAVIDNMEMNIAEQNEAVFDQLTEWGWMDYEVNPAEVPATATA